MQRNVSKKREMIFAQCQFEVPWELATKLGLARPLASDVQCVVFRLLSSTLQKFSGNAEQPNSHRMKHSASKVAIFMMALT